MKKPNLEKITRPAAPVAVPAGPTGGYETRFYEPETAPLPPPQEPTIPANLLTWYGFSDLPPLPYRSGTTHQPWPNDSKIYDAKGKDVEKRNWKEGMAARGFMVMAANFVHELIKQNIRPVALAGETRTEALNVQQMKDALLALEGTALTDYTHTGNREKLIEALDCRIQLKSWGVTSDMLSPAGKLAAAASRIAQLEREQKTLVEVKEFWRLTAETAEAALTQTQADVRKLQWELKAITEQRNMWWGIVTAGCDVHRDAPEEAQSVKCPLCLEAQKSALMEALELANNAIVLGGIGDTEIAKPFLRVYEQVKEKI